MSFKNLKYIIKLFQVKKSTIKYLIVAILVNIFVTLIVVYNANFISKIINNFMQIEIILSFRLIILLVSLNVLAGILNYFDICLESKIKIMILECIRKKYINKVLSLKIKYTFKFTKSRITYDFNNINNIDRILTNFSKFIKLTVAISIIILYIFILNFKFLLFCSIIIISTILISNRVKISLSELNKNLYSNSIHLALKLKDSMKGINVIKAFSCEEKFIKDFADTNENILNENLKIDFKCSLIGCITVLLNILPLVICIYYGAYLVLNGYISQGELIAIIPLITKLSQDLSSWFLLTTEINKDLVIIESIFEIFYSNFSEEDATLPINTLKKCEITKFKKNNTIIDFKNVSFKYNDTYILKDLTFNIKKGEKVAIVGNSGCGKSTLLKLILKFYECTQGQIKIYGKNINDINSIELRRNINFLEQEPYIFPMTIEDNIKLVNKDANLIEIENVVKIAYLEDFINSLHLKYRTKINENSTNISGGEKQRLAIARSLLRDSEIILMDEPTSSLDVKTELKIKENLFEFLRDKTCVIVSHNLKFIKDCDKILVLDHGMIVESGSHEKLMHLNNIYYKLFSSKSKS